MNRCPACETNEFDGETCNGCGYRAWRRWLRSVIGILALICVPLVAADVGAGVREWTKTSNNHQKDLWELTSAKRDLENRVSAMQLLCKLLPVEVAQYRADIASANEHLLKAREAWLQWMRGPGKEQSVTYHVGWVKDVLEAANKQLDGLENMETGDIPCEIQEEGETPPIEGDYTGAR